MARKKQSAGSARQTSKTEASSQTTDSDVEPLFFHMPNAEDGEYCQWYPSTFTVSTAEIASVLCQPPEPEDVYITFGCAEQFMMYCKAARFADCERQAKIMATSSPKEQKRLGKLTVGFSDESWDQVKSQVVVVGNLAKFRQNPHLARQLLATGDRMICEAASQDRVWGIGYSAKNAMSQQSHWGENRLGKALMQVREQLRAELEEPE